MESIEACQDAMGRKYVEELPDYDLFKAAAEQTRETTADKDSMLIKIAADNSELRSSLVPGIFLQ